MRLPKYLAYLAAIVVGLTSGASLTVLSSPLSFLVIGLGALMMITTLLFTAKKLGQTSAR